MAFNLKLIHLFTAVGLVNFWHVETGKFNGGTTLSVSLNYTMIVRINSGFVIYRTFPNTGREYLVLKMQDEKKWTCPEGLVEHGESEDDAAERHLKEFTGLLLNDIVYAHEYKKCIKHGDIPVNVTVFRVGELTFNKKIIPHPYCEEFKWLPLEEASKITNNISSEALLQINEYLIDMNI